MASVGAEEGGIEDLHPRSDDFIKARGDDGCGGMAFHDFEGEIGARDGTDLETSGFFFEDIAHPQVGAGFDTFGGAEQDLIGFEKIAKPSCCFAKGFGGDDGDKDRGLGGFFKLGGGMDIGG